MYLSTHFTLEEMTFSSTADRLGIDNTTKDPVILENLRYVCQQMEEVRIMLSQATNKDCPIIVESGLRVPALNDVIPGSSKTSAHTKGFAIDWTCPSFGTPYEIAKFLEKHIVQLKIDQIIMEYSWVHCGFSTPPRNQLLTKCANKPYQVGINKC
jgi:hypothetical protein